MKTLCLSIALLAFIASFLKTGDAGITGWTIPTGGDGSVNTPENNAAGATVTTLDATSDSTNAVYALVGSSTMFEIDSNGDVNVLTANLFDFEGTTTSYIIEFTVADDEPSTTSGTLTITVTDVDEAPVFTDSTPVSTCFDSPVALGTTVLTVTATDPEGSAVTYSKDASITNAALDMTGANVVTQSEISSYQVIAIEADDTTVQGTAIAVIRVGGCSKGAVVAVSVLTILGALLVSLS